MFPVVECEMAHFPIVKWPNVMFGLRMSGDAQVLTRARQTQLFTKRVERGTQLANNFCVRSGGVEFAISDV